MRNQILQGHFLGQGPVFLKKRESDRNLSVTTKAILGSVVNMETCVFELEILFDFSVMLVFYFKKDIWRNNYGNRDIPSGPFRETSLDNIEGKWTQNP